MSGLSWIARRAAQLPNYFDPTETAVDAIHRAGGTVDQVFGGTYAVIVRQRSDQPNMMYGDQVKKVASGIRITGNHDKLADLLKAAAPPNTHVAQLLLEGRIDIELVAA